LSNCIAREKGFGVVELPDDPEQRATLFRDQAVVAFKLASESRDAERRAALLLIASEWLKLASELDGFCRNSRA